MSAAVEFTPAVLALLRERAGGRCEGCGRLAAHLEAHHRKFRSRGGLGTPENGAMLCGWGNHTGCHGAAHGQGDYDKEWGWSLQSWQNPAEEPFVDLRGEVWNFLPDGTKVALSEVPTVELDPWTLTATADPWSA